MIAAVGNAITRRHGRGATTTRTIYQRNHVVTFHGDIYTPVERTRIEAGQQDEVKRTRQAFQMAMKDASRAPSRRLPADG